MNYTPIGRVRPIHRGAHDPSAAYEALDVVRREDGFASYMAKKDVPAGTPLADGEHWGLLSDAGLKAVADASCPRFEASGGAAVCHPVAGYPLEVRSVVGPVQSGSGEPSPDNIRPISGLTGAKLTRCGGNLLKYTSATVGTTTVSGVTFTVNADGTITADGTATANAILILTSSDSNPTLRNALLGKQISMSGCPSGGGVNKYVMRLFQHAGENSRVDDAGSGVSATFENAGLAYNVAIIVWSGVTVSNLVFRPMIRLESGADYEPYVGDTYAANFGQTVYGGTMDWTAGVLTSEWAMVTLTGNETCDAYGSSGAFLLRILTDAVTTGYTEIPQIVCSHYATRTRSDISNGTNVGVSIGTVNTHLIVYPGSDYTADTFKSYLAAQNTAGTPVQIVYKLAAPVSVQLTPQEIAALDGVNTLCSDAGGTTAAGRTDMTWLTQDIMDRLAALEAAAVSE